MDGFGSQSIAEPPLPPPTHRDTHYAQHLSFLRREGAVNSRLVKNETFAHTRPVQTRMFRKKMPHSIFIGHRCFCMTA